VQLFEMVHTSDSSSSSQTQQTGSSVSFKTVSEQTSNGDGRLDSPLLPEDVAKRIAPGDVFKLHFKTGDYFSRMQQKCFYPFVDIVFTIEDPSSHYHVPLLISPYGQMTYRGS